MEVQVSQVRIHPTAEVSPEAHIGDGTKIWHQVQVREGVRIGNDCVIGKGAYIDHDVTIGSNTKIQNGAFIFHGSQVEDAVFIGPNACLTNDKYPRAITSDGRLKRGDDWEVGTIVVRYGASIGAGAVILPNVVIGAYARVGAGAVVTSNVPDHRLVRGNPASLIGFVCKCGRPLKGEAGRKSECRENYGSECVETQCKSCNEKYHIPQPDFTIVEPFLSPSHR